MTLRLTTIAFIAGFLLAVNPAHAAEYRVVQCGAAGAAHDFLPGSSDPVLYAQDRCASVAGLSLKGIPNTVTRVNGAATWLAFAPDGTTFSSWEAEFQGGTGDASIAVYARACRDLGCISNDQLFYGLPEWAGPQVKRWQGRGAIMLLFALHCSFGSSGGCTLRPNPPGGDMFAPRMTLTDHHAPAPPTISGGTLPGSTWRSARQPQSVAFTASDRGGGVDHVRVTIDDVAHAVHSAPCARTAANAYTRLLPCPLTTAGQMPIDISKLADGMHSFSLAAIDAAGQASSSGSQVLRVDNTAPASPSAPFAIGGEGWRQRDGFQVRWNVPKNQHAPVVATHWRICPVGAGSCRSGRVANSTSLDVSAGRSGRFTLQLSLEDAAGNHDPGSAATLPLRLDSDPPRPRFALPGAADPLAVVVNVDEPLSGLASGAIEMRREGTTSWTALDTTSTGSKLIARIDDELLSEGRYELRARAVDHAGNEGSTTQQADGEQATLQLPIRLTTQLRAGVRRPGRQVVSVRRNGRRKRVVKRTSTLVRQARISLGSQATIEGALVDGRGAPLAGVDVAVAKASVTSRSRFEPAGLARTDAGGRFSYRLRPRHSQLVRLRYDGSRHVRGATADVLLQVPAASTIRASDRSVLNGDTVRFSGRLRTLPAPAGGKLMEMQAFFRDRWRTFSTVRTDRSGRWSFDYSFGGTVGTVLYRFRIHMPREGGYPFESGNSRIRKVVVHGP